MKSIVFSPFFSTFAYKNRIRMKRERQFEVMRTLAMFFIVVYHCLTHGVGDGCGFSTSSPVCLSNALTSDLMLVFSSIAVNLYVMTSGYFLVDLNFKASRIVRTWSVACFYSFVITLLFMALCIVPFNLLPLCKSLFPISFDAYWFVTQYIGLLILSPFLAIMVRNLSYRQYLALLVGGAFICLTIIPDFPFGKRYYVAHGNSVWSFAYLFLIAGFIKHHLKENPISRIMMTIILLVLLILSCEVIGGYHQGNVHLYWLNYNGLALILSVAVFILVRQLKVPDNGFWNILVKVAPYSFGVYLIHDHLLIRDWLWSNVSLTTYCDQLLYPIIVIGLCLVIYMVCTIIDAVRKKLFSILRIDDLIAKVDQWSFTHEC